ncbi:hypothetical protein SAMN02745857_03974 [Andreprevotia lacus DSM 23236]|jgi:hypothetical protein|uniref:Uncharacterized protein n=1 Tax=Andreprevotia lacus DSM 23236 TaxID=1121001 RepID=A0A1W1Y0G8_9NEIS|nr:hypothetical protein [Andreprevotia lacus]SMC29634.1 hypothetical protein SAMN02745857_03974 [Andreprevotia lacus DSM 23236]
MSHTHHDAHAHDHGTQQPAPARPAPGPTLLALPAWQRVLLVLPLIAALWLAAWWALA